MCNHVFILFFFFFFAQPTDRPSREGGRWERNILWGWPKGKRVNGVCATKSFIAGSVVFAGGYVLKTKTPKNPKTPQDPRQMTLNFID